MTTHIANCGYSSLFTAGLFNVEPGQYSPSNAQASFLDQFCQTSPSPRVLLPSSKHSFDEPAHLHIQVPSSTEQRRQFRIVSPTSPIKSSLFSVGTMWLLNRRRDVNRRNALQTLSAGREHNGAYHLSQAVSRIKRCICASPKPPPTAPLPSPPLSPRSDDTSPDPGHTIVSTQKQTRLRLRLVNPSGIQTLTSVVNGDWPSSPFQCEGEAIPDSPMSDEKEFSSATIPSRAKFP